MSNGLNKQRNTLLSQTVSKPTTVRFQGQCTTNWAAGAAQLSKFSPKFYLKAELPKLNCDRQGTKNVQALITTYKPNCAQ